MSDEHHVYNTWNNRASTWLPSKMGGQQTAYLIQKNRGGGGGKETEMKNKKKEKENGKR